MEEGVYDVTSLRLNLQGDMSSKQRRKMIIHSFLWFILSGGSIISSIIMIIFQILFYQTIYAFFVWMIFLVVMGLLGYQHAQPFWKDIQENKVAAISGELAKYYAFRNALRARGGIDVSEGTYFLIRVDGVVFSVSPTLYSSLIDGVHYRLFFAPNSKWVLNVTTLKQKIEENINE